MPVPKRKVSRSRRDKAFANKGIKVKAITICSNCADPLKPHQACLNCGFYKGVKILANSKQDRSIRRGKQKDAKRAAEGQSEKSE